MAARKEIAGQAESNDSLYHGIDDFTCGLTEPGQRDRLQPEGSYRSNMVVHFPRGYCEQVSFCHNCIIY